MVRDNMNTSMLPNIEKCPISKCGCKLQPVGEHVHMGAGWYDQIVECPGCGYVDVNSYRKEQENDKANSDNNTG